MTDNCPPKFSEFQPAYFGKSESFNPSDKSNDLLVPSYYHQRIVVPGIDGRYRYADSKNGEPQ